MSRWIYVDVMIGLKNLISSRQKDTYGQKKNDKLFIIISILELSV